MKVTLDFPDEWDTVLIQAAADRGIRSMSEFMRQAVVRELERMGKPVDKLPPASKRWGRAKVTKDTKVAKDIKVTKDTKDYRDTTCAPAEEPVGTNMSGVVPLSGSSPSFMRAPLLSPNEILRQRKAEAAAKHPAATPPRNSKP